MNEIHALRHMSKKMTRAINFMFSIIRLNKVGKLGAEDRSRDRVRRAALTSITAALARVISMATPLITIPATLGYLGHEIFGLWMTITSFIGLFVFADLGLGSGLLTALSRSQGSNDAENAKRLISTTMFLLMAVAVLFGIILILLWPIIPWSRVFNATSPIAGEAASGVVGAYVICFLLNLPLTTVQRTQMALQEGFQSHLWLCCGSIINIGVLFVAIYLKFSAPYFVFIVTATPILITGFNWIHFFFRMRPDLRPAWAAFSWSSSQLLFSSGVAFFLLSMLTTVGMSADNFLIARICGLESVTKYAVPARMALLLNAVVTIVCSPMWAANGEALARGDVDWVWRNTIKLIKYTVGFTCISAVLFTVLGPPFLHLWLGSSFEVSPVLLAGLGINSICLAASAPLFMYLNGANVIYPQVIIFLIFTPFAITVKALFLHYFGFTGVAWAGALSYLIIVLPSVYCLSKRSIGKDFAKIRKIDEVGKPARQRLLQHL